MTMATVKADTRHKDQLRKQEAAMAAKRADQATVLKNLLAGLAQIGPTVVDTAADALMDAADQYKAAHPLVDPKGRRSRPRIAEGRASMATVGEHLAKARDALSALPLDARTAIGQATDSPLGKMLTDIDQMRRAVEKALISLNARPDKVANEARRILAYEVAVVFRDILKMKPTSTSERQLTQNMSTGRGGAAYARVLSATLNAAGVTDYDPGPLITEGLSLLRDPKLPSRP
jgi:hypothetical protein